MSLCGYPHDVQDCAKVLGALFFVVKAFIFPAKIKCDRKTVCVSVKTAARSGRLFMQNK